MNTLYNSQDEEKDNFNLVEIIAPYFRSWKAYIISVTLCLIGAFVYLRQATPIYQVSTSIMLKEEDKGGGSIGALSEFEGLGLGVGTSNVDNELEILNSRFLIHKVIEKLEVNVSYWEIDGFIRKAYYKNTPFVFKSVGGSTFDYNSAINLKVIVINENEFSLQINKETVSKTYSWGNTINHKDLKFILIPDIESIKGFIGSEFAVSVVPIDIAVNGLKARLTYKAAAKKNDVIKISLKDASQQRAKDVLNTLVELYNSNAIEDKKEVNLKTKEFIKNRLDLIKEELASIEQNAESFKQEHRLLDIQSQSSLFSQSISKSKEDLSQTETQIRLAEFMSEHLIDKEKEFALIPVNLGIENQGLIGLSRSYNDIVIERNRIVQSTNLLNPVIKNLDTQLKDLKDNIQVSLNNYIEVLKITKQELKSQEQLINDKIAAIPQKERQYRSIARQQELKESLYLFLLQKHEETSLSLAATSSNSKVIDVAYGSRKPVAPVGRLILLIGFIIGIMIPTVVVYIKELLNTKVHNKKELESLVGEIPILGDIPKNATKDLRIKTTSDRSSMAEAFRILTTNMNFMIGSGNNECKTICITSTISGEGKTYMSANLSTVLSFSKKKVLLIGTDVRSPKMADYFVESQQHMGLTNYLSDLSMRVSDIVVKQSDNPFLDVIFSGIIPPNPVELLSSNRFKELLDQVKKEYDYIIMDSAPVSLVTDTLLISKYADMFIYVTRAEYLDKRMLEIPRNLFKQERLPNMAMVLNDIDVKKGYGTGYGYGYGTYGEYGEKRKKKWRLFGTSI